MRPLTKLIVIFCLLVSCQGFAGSIDTVGTEGPKLKSYFVCKSKRKFLGAKVEIISSKGKLITSSELSRRKLVIDFGEVQHGKYTIRLSKGDEKQEFVYYKKE